MPRRDDIKKVMIIGSGPIVIGQACEFDYSSIQACKALRKLGYEIVLVNSNPATIMTDPGLADVTYVEPLNFQAVKEIIEKERPDAILPNLGGQSGLNLSSELARKGVLEEYGVKVIGVDVDAIERGEDRIAFKETMEQLGINLPKSASAYSVEEAEKIANELGYPVLIPVSERERPSVLEVAGQFEKLGFHIKATEGTQRFLAENGIESEHILKMHEGRPNTVDGIMNKEIHLAINTPSGKLSKHDDTYISRSAIRYKVPYITTLAAAIAAGRGIEAYQHGHGGVRSLQSYHEDLEEKG